MTTVGQMLAETHRSATAATRIAVASFVIALLAFVASACSAYFSYFDSKADERWQAQQLEALKVLSTLLEAQSESASSLLIASEAQVDAIKGLKPTLDGIANKIGQEHDPKANK